MRRWLTVCCLIIACIPTLLWASSFEQARELYNKAMQEDSLARQAELLEESVASYPTFNGWYMLGRVYQEQKQEQDALQAYSRAREAAAKRQAQALALGRMGQIQGAQGNLAKAASCMGTAMDLHPDPPQWMQEGLKQIELAKGSCVASREIVAEVHDSVNRTRSLSQKNFQVRPSIDLRILFDFDSARLNSQGRQQVTELAQALSDPQLKGYDFTLVGHTDKRGSAAYNQRLSEQRARAVARAVIQREPSLRSRLQTRGKGESELRFAGDAQSDHRLNRRVEIQVQGG